MAFIMTRFTSTSASKVLRRSPGPIDFGLEGGERLAVKSNWSGNIEFSAAELHEPATVEELQQIVSRARRLRVVGAGHSFNDIVDTDGTLVSLRRLNRVVAIDRDASTVLFEGGILHYELTDHLHRAGFALHNLPSMPHFNVVGACATGTHGSGDTNRCLAAAIRGMEIVTAGGDLVEVPAADLPATAIGLGAFGVVARMTLEIESTFYVAQERHVDVPVANAIDNLDEIMGSAYSVSYFTDWQHDRLHEVWRKFRLDTENGPIPDTPDDYFGGTRAGDEIEPGMVENDVNVTRQMLIPGPWHERLPHVRVRDPIQVTSQLQSEFFVARRHGQSALRAIAELGERLKPAIGEGIVAEVRTVAADDLWLSPFPHPSLALHFGWVPDWPSAEKALPLVEAALAPFEPRPHWGKLFTMPAETVRDCYPRFADFVARVAHYDPAGKFRNRYLEQLFV